MHSAPKYRPIAPMRLEATLVLKSSKNGGIRRDIGAFGRAGLPEYGYLGCITELFVPR
jgi:hypothetical protein